MKKVQQFLTATTTLLFFSFLAGCSAPVVPTPEEKPDMPEVQEVADREETVEYATQQQVASVIAQYEPDWREVLEEKLDCQLIWTIAEQDPSDFAANLEGMTCMSSVHTMTVTADTAIMKLGELNVSPDMSDLVEETTGYLRRIADSGVSEACDLGGNAAEESCEMPMLSFELASKQLEQSLNAWSPYL